MKEKRKIHPLALKVKDWIQTLMGPVDSCRIKRISISASSEIYSVDVFTSNQRNRYILRKITNTEWFAREPDLCDREASALKLARELSVPTPDIVAFDSTCAQLGYPSILMTEEIGITWAEEHLPDRQTLLSLASTLKAIHGANLGQRLEVLPEYQPHYHDTTSISGPPSWTMAPDAWEAAIEIYRKWVSPSTEPGKLWLVHRDYRLGNTLWTGVRITAVLDWITACRGVYWADVGHCRWNLRMMYGKPTMELFSGLYGIKGYDPIYDILAAVGGLPDMTKIDFWQERELDNFVIEAIAAHTKVSSGGAYKHFSRNTNTRS